LLEFADPVRGGLPILSASCDEPGALKILESGFLTGWQLPHSLFSRTTSR